VCYHVINRGNARAEVFHTADDYAAFVRLLREADERLPIRLIGYCLMPNHFHLVVWPRADGDLSRWMQWLMTSHVRRYHRVYESSGHVWQGRFRAFPVQSDEHLLSVLQYVESNPIRARGLRVRRAENWLWSSASKKLPADGPHLVPGPTPRPAKWSALLNDGQDDVELEALRQSVNRGTPYGSPRWQQNTAKKLGLGSTMRPRGRPRTRPVEE
jgi:putative transposase